MGGEESTCSHGLDFINLSDFSFGLGWNMFTQTGAVAQSIRAFGCFGSWPTKGQNRYGFTSFQHVLGTRTLLGAPGIATNGAIGRYLLGAPGHTTNGAMFASRSKGHRYERNKNILVSHGFTMVSPTSLVALLSRPELAPTERAIRRAERARAPKRQRWRGCFLSFGGPGPQRAGMQALLLRRKSACRAIWNTMKHATGRLFFRLSLG